MPQRLARILLGSSLSSVCCLSSVPPRAAQPLFTFGVIADVQWADTEDGWNYVKTVSRKYRGAFRTLQRAVTWWNALPQPPKFIAQLGDLLDGINVELGQSNEALEAALDELQRADCPSVNLVGNHELYNFDRAALADASWLRHGDKEYYSMPLERGWRLVVLDPYQQALIGLAQDDPRRQEAAELISRKNPGVDLSGSGGEWFTQVEGYDRRFVPYNGGLGSAQLAWLRDELAAAAAAEERVIILCHVILHPLACGGGTMCWDYDQALETIASEEAAGCVAAVLCGHDHFGQYHHDEASGVHHCTFCSPLNLGDGGDTFGLVSVWPDAIEIRGPRVDDLLPAERGGKPTGRPAKVDCEADATSPACESVMLPLSQIQPKGEQPTGAGTTAGSVN